VKFGDCFSGEEGVKEERLENGKNLRGGMLRGGMAEEEPLESLEISLLFFAIYNQLFSDFQNFIS
jgi:hypothetical protein